jgi:hypothetical protein
LKAKLAFDFLMPNGQWQMLTSIRDQPVFGRILVLVREERHNGKTIYICNCGLGYDDMLIAYACEEYARTHGVNSEDIIKRAVYNPRTERLTRRTVAQ